MGVPYATVTDALFTATFAGIGAEYCLISIAWISESAVCSDSLPSARTRIWPVTPEGITVVSPVIGTHGAPLPSAYCMVAFTPVRIPLLSPVAVNLAVGVGSLTGAV